MTDHVPYGQRMVERVLSDTIAASFTPAEIDQIKAWGKQQDTDDAAQVRSWAADVSHAAYEQRSNALETANEVFDFLADLQTQSHERRIEASAAVSALKEGEERLAHLRRLRERLAGQVTQAIYLNEKPHEVIDDLWRRFPAIGDRPTPPHAHITRGS